MTPTQIRAAALRNSRARRGQIDRLRPLLPDVRAKVESLRSAKNGVKETKKSIEFMSRMKHVPNFFPTPRRIVAQMIELADIKDGMEVLEPSAGKGDIIMGVRQAMIDGRAGRCAFIAVEIIHALAERLVTVDCVGRTRVYCADFLEWESRNLFDRVMMNPPFERGIDRAHIEHAFQFLKPGGRLVAIACSTTGQKLTDWADEVIPLPAGSFANSENPTQVSTCIVIKNK